MAMLTLGAMLLWWFGPRREVPPSELTSLRPGVPEPYAELHGGSFGSHRNELSPDPLAAYRWRETGGMQIYALRPIAVFDLGDAFKGDAVRLFNGSRRYDFGVESAAWFEFDSPDLHLVVPAFGAKVAKLLGRRRPVQADDDGTVTCSLSENTHREPNKTKAPVPVFAAEEDGRVVVTYRHRTSPEWYEGIRYVWIDVVGSSGGKEWHIDDVRLICQVRPTNYEGSFASSDPLLTRLWYTGAYTVKVALLEDGIASELMDRGDRQNCNFGGYGQPILRTLYAAFGEYQLADRFNNITATWQHDADIQSYWMYWTETIFDWYLRTGDLLGMKKYIPMMVDRLDTALDLYAEAAKNGTAPIRMFGDDERLGFEFEWPDSLPEAQLAYRMVVLRAVRRFAAVMKDIDETDLATRYGAIAENLIAELRQKKWTTELGVHSGADAVTAGFMTFEELNELRPVYASGSRPSWSPFNGWYILMGLDEIDSNAALDLTRTTWGGNLAAGATCYWERFDPLWLKFLNPGDPPAGGINDVRTSECHPWSAGITAWLTESVLGLQPIKPGFTQWQAIPRHFVSSNLTWVNGSVPTPRGPAAAWFNVRTGNHGVVVPPQTSARVGLPRMASGLATVALDGVRVWQNSSKRFVFSAGTSDESCCKEEDDNRYLFCSISSPGRHDIRVTYMVDTTRRRSIKFQPTMSLSPGVTVVGIDRVTSGNWIGRYGTSGYVLYGYGAEGNVTQLRKLPPFVRRTSELAWRNTPARVVTWTNDTNDERALAAPASQRRIAAGITSKKQASFTVDIDAAASTIFNISLYCVDFHYDVIAQKNIRVMKLSNGSDNLEVLTDIVPLRSFDNTGVYVTYQVNCSDNPPDCGSLRFRFFEMYDPAVPLAEYPAKPVLSGLFFD